MSTTKKRISSPQVPEPPPQTWSNCLVVGNQVFVAGMIARDGDKVLGGDSMYEQAKVIFGKIKHLMEAAGGPHGRHRQGADLRDRHQAPRRSLESPARGLHGRLPGVDPRGGPGPRRPRDPRRGRSGGASSAPAPANPHSSRTHPSPLAAGGDTAGPGDGSSRPPPTEYRSPGSRSHSLAAVSSPRGAGRGL